MYCNHILSLQERARNNAAVRAFNRPRLRVGGGSAVARVCTLWRGWTVEQEKEEQDRRRKGAHLVGAGHLIDALGAVVVLDEESVCCIVDDDAPVLLRKGDELGELLPRRRRARRVVRRAEEDQICRRRSDLLRDRILAPVHALNPKLNHPPPASQGRSQG